MQTWSSGECAVGKYSLIKTLYITLFTNMEDQILTYVYREKYLTFFLDISLLNNH